MDVGHLMERYQKAHHNWQKAYSLHQEAAELSMPNREQFSKHSPGQRKDFQVYDSTAVLGLVQFSSRIVGSLVPSWQPWASLVPGETLEDDVVEDAQAELEMSTKILFRHLNHSNFASEISPAFLDLGIGTGAILIEEAPFTSQEVFRFTNIPLSQLYPEKPPRGPIESAWYDQEMYHRDILSIWPRAKLPQMIMDAIDHSPMKNIKFIVGHVKEGEVYKNYVIHQETKSIIFEQSFNTKRLILFRWHLVPGEVFGRGPIIQVLPDISTLNRIKKYTLDNAALQTAGVYTVVDDGIFNPHTVRISPGSVIPVSSNASVNPTLAPLARSGDLGVSFELIQDLQDVVRRALFVDPLGDVTDPVRSATEMLIRQQEQLKVSGASFGRLKTELIEPLIGACVDILVELGEIQPIRVDGKEVTIKQQSPLAKMEDSEEFQTSQLWMAQMAQLPPEIMAGTVKLEDLPKFWLNVLGLPMSLVRSPEEQQAIAGQVQEAAEAELGGGLGDAPGAGGPIAEPLT